MIIKPPVEITSQPQLQIRCVDKDKDDYCSWGISDAKPLSCPVNCRSEKDCDDSNDELGGFDANYRCISISGNATQDTIAPVIGRIAPLSTRKESETNFFVQISDNNTIANCNLMINGPNDSDNEYSIYGLMNFSVFPCHKCTANSKITFLREGKYSLYAQCSDDAGNTSTGKAVDIIVSPVPSNIGVIQPTAAKTNQGQRFSAIIDYGKEIVTCALKINGSPVGYMNLSESPCTNCTASIDYVFKKAGGFTAIVHCIDKDGSSFEGTPTTITVNGGCPSCNNNKTDACENPAKCEKDCGADAKCDEKEPNYSWILQNTCYGCNSKCELVTDSNKPVSYSFYSDKIVGSQCSYGCDVKCGGSGWYVGNCKNIVPCSPFKVSGNACYYQRNCNQNGCTYQTSLDKFCSSAVCTASGWDNTKCPKPYALSVILSGTGTGQVMDTAGIYWINCTNSNTTRCKLDYAANSQVTLKASPDSGSSFASWSGACSGTNTTCTVTMNSAKNVTATFNKIPVVLTWKPCAPGSCTGSSSCGYVKKSIARTCATNETVETGKCMPMPNNHVEKSYKSGNGWYCEFHCNSSFCWVSDGCAYVQCKK